MRRRELGGPRATRRVFLKLSAAAVLGAEAAGASASETATDDHPGFFTDPERALLARLAEQVLPGAATWGAVEYIEQLLTAFDHDPPRIHAGGPFSGRQPFARNGRPTDEYPDDDFARFLPLNRVQERAWRLRLFGSDAVPHPNEALLGPVVGLRPLFKRALAAALPHSDDLDRAWDSLSEEFRTQLAELVIESSLGDPVYGGNRDRAGWRAFHFDGDSLPLGYTLYDEGSGRYRERADAPVSTLAAGADPDPMRLSTRVWLWLMAFLSRWFEPS